MTHCQPTITVELVDGTQVVVPDSLDLLTPYVLQEQGDWFEDEIRFLRRLIQPGQSVVDIGADYGVYTLSLARRVGPGGHVWTFEQASATADLLAASIEANGTSWVSLERQAVSGATREEEPFTTLDACLQRLGWRQLDLLRIHAVGEVEKILAGGQKFFRGLSPLVMLEMREGDELRLDLVARFAELGYACFRLVPGLNALMPFDPEAGVDGYLLNLFAAKPERIASLSVEGWLVESAQPSPPDPSQLEPYQWQRSLGALPYARELGPVWEGQAPTESGKTVHEALAHWAFSRDHTQPLDLRLGALQRSLQFLQSVSSQKAPLPRWSSLARVALDLGERSLAMRALGHLIPALEEGTEPDLSEPFLAVMARYDTIEPEKRLADWLDSAALETEEHQGSYSTYYTGVTARARLEKLEALGFAGPGVYRRLHLLERRFPQAVPASPGLAGENPIQISCSREAWELLAQGRIQEGMVRLTEAKEMGDRCAKALHYIGKALFSVGNLTEAVAVLQRAVELDPSNASILMELGMGLKSSGEAVAAQAVLQQAVLLYGFRFASQEPTASNLANLGIAYDELGEKEQALECLEQALALDPAMEDALLRKAAILFGMPDRHDEAMTIWHRIIADDPDHLGALSNCANLHTTYGELPEAIRLLEHCLECAPDNRTLHHLLAFVHSISGKNAVEAHLQHLKGYWQQVRGSFPEAASHAVSFSLPAVGSKVRVGFLSAELGDHVVSLFLEPFLTNYNRERFEVELIEVREHHTVRSDGLRALADAVVTVQGLTLEEARQRVRSRGYHLIVETSGFARDSGIEILARRCAPVQCHYIGFHASTGLDTIDWFIGDEITVAEDLTDQFVEKLWRLPRPWLASRRHPDLPEALSRVDSSAPVLGSFNQFGKVREETVQFWAAALRRVPKAVLHLKNYTTDSEIPHQRICEEMENEGIDPGRIAFLPRTASWQEHLECYQAIDLALDTTPWSGATTTFDALAMGVPVVGILGATTASRMSCSILRGLGREEWITATPDQFAIGVQRLVSDLPQLRASRPELRQQFLSSALFDGADLAHHLQEAFLAMVHERVGGRKGASLAV